NAAPSRGAIPPPRTFNNQTVRMIARTSIGGRRVRIGVSNQFGGTPVVIDAAHLALRGKESEIVEGSDRALTFNGKPACTIGPGVVISSDPVDLNVPPLADVAVSLFFPSETGPVTAHGTGLHTTYISKEGDSTGQASIAEPTTTMQYYYL